VWPEDHPYAECFIRAKFNPRSGEKEITRHGSHETDAVTACAIGGNRTTMLQA